MSRCECEERKKSPDKRDFKNYWSRLTSSDNKYTVLFSQAISYPELEPWKRREGFKLTSDGTLIVLKLFIMRVRKAVLEEE